MDWELFYSCLRTVIFSNEDWAVFCYDETVLERHGVLCLPSAEHPEPGTYILLRSGMEGQSTPWRLPVLSCRWYPDHCGLEHRFSPCSSFDYLQYLFKGKSHTHDKTFSPNTTDFPQTEHYRTRVRARDPCCLISGLQVIRGDYSRFKAAHIFPRAHDVQACRYPSIPAVLTMQI